MAVSNEFVIRRKKFALQRKSWDEICGLIKSCTDIRKAMCYGCGQGTLYDNKGEKYRVSGSNTIEEVNMIIEKIRTINGSI